MGLILVRVVVLVAVVAAVTATVCPKYRTRPRLYWEHDARDHKQYNQTKLEWRTDRVGKIFETRRYSLNDGFENDGRCEVGTSLETRRPHLCAPASVAALADVDELVVFCATIAHDRKRLEEEHSNARKAVKCR